MLNFVELFDIIAGGESETVEFKKSPSLMRKAVETVCAFANQRGGPIWKLVGARPVE